MKTKSLFFILCVISSWLLNEASGQIGMNDDSSVPDSSAMLDVKSSTKGILIPRMTDSMRNAISGPATGLMIFCTDDGHFYANKGTPAFPDWAIMDSHWITSGDHIYFDEGSVGINSLPSGSYQLKVDGDGSVTAVYGYNNTALSGNMYVPDSTVNGVVGFASNGNAYHFGVFGSRTDNAFGPSAGVIGSVSYNDQNKPWGALGFQDAELGEYAGYFNGNININGGLKDGSGFGVSGSVLLSDGVDDIYWSATPGISGSGTANYIPKWSSATELTSSGIYESGSNVSIGTTSSSGKLTVNSGGTSTAIYGQNTASRLGYLGSGSYGAYGQSSSTLYGYLGGNYGAYGQMSSSLYGYMGGANYGAYGQNTSGRYGYLGGADYGAYGQNSSSFYGGLGAISAGVYGRANVYSGGAAGYFEHNGMPSGYASQWAVDARMTNSIYNDGSSYAYNATGNNSGSVRGWCNNGALYTFGVAGWNWNDETRCAGVFGGQYLASYWGGLGYKDSGGTGYGGYFTSYTTGSGEPMDLTDPEGIGIGAWGGLIGADIHGGVYGIYVEGNNFGIYSKGPVISDQNAIQLQDIGESRRAVTYYSSSMDASISLSGQGALANGYGSVIYDEIFGKLISREVPVVITVTPMGPSNGVYISSSDSHGFSVTENNGGKSNVSFYYNVIGRRDGYVNPELPEEVVSSDFESIMTEGLHNDAVLTSSGKGIQYQGKTLQLGHFEPVMQIAK